MEGDPLPDLEALIVSALNRIRRLLADPAASSQNTLLQSIALNRQPHGGFGQQQIPILGPAGEVIDDNLVMRRGQPAYGSKAAKSAGAGKRALAGLPPDIRIRAVDEASKAGVKLNEEVDERLQALLASSSQQSHISVEEHAGDEHSTLLHWLQPDQLDSRATAEDFVSQPFLRREGDDAMRSPSRQTTPTTTVQKPSLATRPSFKRSLDDIFDVSPAQAYAETTGTSALATRFAGKPRTSLWEAASGL